MAGRTQAKLDEVRDAIGAPGSVPLVLADATDTASLGELVRRAAVVISTVGPYQLYGTPLGEACAAAGAHHVDLTRESNWIAAMVEAHEPTAKALGAPQVFA